VAGHLHLRGKEAARPAPKAPTMHTVRSRLWLWGHAAGSHSGLWNLPATSSITPALAVRYMGIPNVIMVVFGGKPEPPFDEAAAELAGIDNLVWSIVGDAGSPRNDEQTDLEPVLELARRQPNVVGAMMDDFFREPDESGAVARFSPADLAGFRDRLHASPPPLDLWVVVYTHDLERPLRPYLQSCDVVTFWTPRAAGLADLERNLARFEERAPGKRTVLGCYMWDYGESRPMPVEMMRRQCELGLSWLRTGRIEGMVFLATCIWDLGLEAVEWTRDWVKRVGDEPLVQ
jgi:hypothetical protein